MCCSTGVCGADVDESLVRFTADLRYLQDRGVDIQRHNLAQDAQTFVDNPVVRNFLQIVGSPGLPLVLVNDVTVATGRYPSREEFLRYAGVAPDAEVAGAVIELGVTDVSASCCGGASTDSASCCGGASTDSACCSTGAADTESTSVAAISTATQASSGAVTASGAAVSGSCCGGAASTCCSASEATTEASHA